MNYRVLGLAEKRLHKRKWKVDCQFVRHHQPWLPCIAALFMPDVRVSNLDDALLETQEWFG